MGCFGEMFGVGWVWFACELFVFGWGEIMRKDEKGLNDEVYGGLNVVY